MRFRLEVKQYRRPFHTPLQTARGNWEVRRGIVLRLKDAEGRTGFGEVAPLEGFGTEGLEEASQFLDSLGGRWDGGLPAELPCCQFALRSAQSWMDGTFGRMDGQLACAALLPAGDAALTVQQARIAEGYRVFKWKAGTLDAPGEMEIVSELAAHGTLRVDANAGLDLQQTRAWLEHLEGIPAVEYLEQPLPMGRWRECIPLLDEFATAIALDEDAPDATGWPGLAIIKPALGRMSAGDIYSSALETSIGKEAALRMAAGSKRAAGFGVRELFAEDGLDLHAPGPVMTVGAVGQKEMEAVWERI